MSLLGTLDWSAHCVIMCVCLLVDHSCILCLNCIITTDKQWRIKGIGGPRRKDELRPPVNGKCRCGMGGVLAALNLLLGD